MNSLVHGLKYKYVEKDTILFNYGDRGDKFYLILKGTISVLITKSEKFIIEHEDYLLYLIGLKIYNQNELLEKTLKENKNIYDYTERQIEDVLKYIKSCSLHTAEIQNYHALKSPMRRQSIYFDNSRILDLVLERRKDLFRLIRNSEELSSKSSVENYCKRILPQICNQGNKQIYELSRYRKEVCLFVYQEIIQLRDGDKFGDIALNFQNQKR